MCIYIYIYIYTHLNYDSNNPNTHVHVDGTWPHKQAMRFDRPPPPLPDMPTRVGMIICKYLVDLHVITCWLCCTCTHDIHRLSIVVAL